MGAEGRHDAFDRRLLNLLRENARIPVSEIAERLGATRAAAYAGIGRLEQDGTIAGFTVRLGAGHAERTVRAHVMIKVFPKLSLQTQEELADMPDLTGLYAIAGEHDFIAMVEAPNLERLNDLIDQIGMLEGVQRTVSSIILAAKITR